MTISTADPVRRATLGDQLRRNARRHPDRPAIVATDGPAGARRVLTYGELDAQVNRLASSLAARGIGRGDVVATMSRNCPETLVAFWAAQKLGAAVTGVNPAFKAHELAHHLAHSGARAIVVEDPSVAAVEALDDVPAALELRIVNEAGADTAPAHWERLGALIAEGSDAEPDVDVDDSAIGLIPYTSGTEALPKGVAIPQRNYLVSTTPAFTTGIGLLDDDVWYYVLPFHTMAGIGMQVVLISLGNTIVLPYTIDAGRALELLVDEGVTIVGQTPTFFLQLIRSQGFESADLSGLRRAITYGGTMPRAMLDAFGGVARNVEWVTLWSQSELSQTPTIGRFRTVDDIPGGDPAWIGRPTALLETRVVNEDGNDATEGELVCRSPGVMAGYHDDPERTAAVLRDGWLHTGDLVRVDDAGNLFFVDRRKDVIKTGGMNVSSVEVERVLYRHPDVLEVAVVGLADEYWSQAVTAFVVARPEATPDPDALIAFCKDELANYKVPKAVRVIDALPKDPQGKILKRVLRDG